MLEGMLALVETPGRVEIGIAKLVRPQLPLQT
jgi:hypothetical protein